MKHQLIRAAACRLRGAKDQTRFLGQPALLQPAAWLTGRRLAAVLSAIALLAGGRAQADASLFIYPTLVLFDGHRTSAEVTISNRGDETGTFEVGWANMSMTPAGALVRHDADVAWAVQPFLRYSPRRVTLAPAESQVIKMALRRDPTVPEGEYYAHMRVVTINSAAPGQADDASPDGGQGVSITARPAIAIPVIWRNSTQAPAATIESVVADSAGNALVLEVARHGLLSARGYVHVIAGQDAGEPVALAEPFPLILYPSVERRSVSVPLPTGIDGGRLPADALVVFAAEDELSEGSTVYSTRQIAAAP